MVVDVFDERLEVPLLIDGELKPLRYRDLVSAAVGDVSYLPMEIAVYRVPIRSNRAERADLVLSDAKIVLALAVTLAVTEPLVFFEEGRYSAERPDCLLLLLLVELERLRAL